MTDSLFCMECDSENITTKFIDFEVPLPLGGNFSYKKEIHVCENCNEEGSFSDQQIKENHERYLAALNEANSKSLNHILEDFSAWDFSLAHIERSLRLPQRTISRWKAAEASDKGISAAGIALLRVVHTYPWMLKVADQDFDKTIAEQELIRQYADLHQPKQAPKDVPSSTTESGSKNFQAPTTSSGGNTESGGNIVRIDEYRDEFLEEA